MLKRRIKEKDLFPPLKAFLEDKEWEVFSEVAESRGTHRADVVAVNGKGDKIVIEMKTSLSLHLLEQAHHWAGSAKNIFIAVPYSSKRRTSFTYKILKDLGIGLIEINLDEYDYDTAYRNISGNYQGTVAGDVGAYGVYIDFIIDRPVVKQNTFNTLLEEHKTWKDGGSASGDGRLVTTYALLMADVYKFLRERKEQDIEDGWVSAKEIWEHLRKNSKPIVVNHYKNPAQSISQALYRFESGDVECVTHKNKKHFRILDESTDYIFE